MNEAQGLPAPQIAPTAIVDATVKLGDGVVIWHWCLLRGPSEVGDFVSFGSGAHMGPRCTIGSRTRIGDAAQIHEPAMIGHRVFIGPNVFIGNDRTPMVAKDWEAQPVRVGDDAVIGAGAYLMGGVSIGAGAVVGMATLVLEDVEPGAVVVAAPRGGLRLLRYRAKHMVGTAFEHWGPVGVDEACWWPNCEG